MAASRTSRRATTRRRRSRSQSFASWKGAQRETATIIGTRAGRDLAVWRGGMPVMVPRAAFDFCLDCGKVDAPAGAALLASAGEGLLDASEVSPAGNRAANDEPALIEP